MTFTNLVFHTSDTIVNSILKNTLISNASCQHREIQLGFFYIVYNLHYYSPHLLDTVFYFVDSIEFSTSTIISVDKGSFTFSVCMPFIYFLLYCTYKNLQDTFNRSDGTNIRTMFAILVRKHQA